MTTLANTEAQLMKLARAAYGIEPGEADGEYLKAFLARWPKPMTMAEIEMGIKIINDQ